MASDSATRSTAYPLPMPPRSSRVPGSSSIVEAVDAHGAAAGGSV